MKKLIILPIIVALTLIKLTTFANSDQIYVADFEIINASPYDQEIIISTEDDEYEFIYTTLPNSIATFQVEKNENEWKSTKIWVSDQDQSIEGYHIIWGILSYGGGTSENQKPGFKDDIENEFKPKNKSNDLSTAINKINNIYDFIIKRTFTGLSYSIKQEESEDEKIHKKIQINIVQKNDDVEFPLTDIKESNRNLLTPYFYEITGNNIDPQNPVYLLGTCHLLSENDYSQEIRQKIEQSEVLISEFPQDDVEKTKEQFTLENNLLIYSKFYEQDLYWFRDIMIDLGYTPDEIKEKLSFLQEKRNELEDPKFFETWFNQLNSNQQEFLNKIAITLGLDLNTLHPAYLDQLIFITRHNLKKEYIEDSYEEYLIRLFIKNNKDVVYLDSLKTILWDDFNEFYGKLKTNLSQAIEEIKLTIQASEQCSTSKKDCWKSFEFIEAANIDSLIAEKINDRPTIARNLAWHEKILNTLNSGKSTSIFTGTYHLKGETGLLNLLKSNGYQIKHGFIPNETVEMINQLQGFSQWQEEVINNQTQIQNNLISEEKIKNLSSD